MTRQELEDLGLDKEQADKVLSINKADVEDAGKEVQTENANLKKQVKERDKQLENLKASAGDNEELKKQIKQLQEDNKTQAAAHEKELTQLKIDTAVDKALTESGAKNNKAVRALLNLDDAALLDDGLVKGLSEQIDKLKADDGSKFLFSESEQPQTKFTGFQPDSSSMVPNSKQAGYEARLAEARKNGNQLEVINIKQEAFQNDGIALM
ncbi:hypothetical protein DW721_07015 [Clostridium sp. AM27-31LB]|uniref:phage scaffolding protein n=1 Tax=Clostridium sp. AM27-31LB TaxID=2293026 RepID=UPI000E47724B|nr:phage scaffolding protein [Clostridium sp. AM27-31LB]RHT94188.1 hypothetical protein DW721_07015 [Clostridium sp. AM27-31LB]